MLLVSVCGPTRTLTLCSVFASQRVMFTLTGCRSLSQLRQANRRLVDRKTPHCFITYRIPQTNEVKYLGIHLDRRLTWRQHITMKRKQLDHKLRSLYWLIGRKLQLTLSNKLLVYTLILKPIWTYGTQLWGSASNSHLDTLERFQSKSLRMLTNAPWFVPNTSIRNDLRVTIRQEVQKHCNTYRQRLTVHPNHLETTLLQGLPCNRRLKRHYPEDLVTRFNYQYVQPPVSKIDPWRLNLKGNASLEVSPS